MFPVKISLCFNILFSVLLVSSPVFAQTANSDSAGSLSESEWNRVILPVMFYTPETKFAGGAAVSAIYRAKGSAVDSRPSSIIPMLIFTTEKQIISQIIFDAYFKNEEYNLKGTTGYIKFPSNFYGVGNNVTKEAEEKSVPVIAKMFVEFTKRVLPELYVGLKFQYENVDINEIESGGLLDSGIFTGSEGGSSVGTGIQVNWDNRDNIMYPTHGRFISFSANLVDKKFGSDYDFNYFLFNARRYFSPYRSHVVALNLVGSIMNGDPPFYRLSTFGGDQIMRGYYNGFYRDRDMIVMQAEYRVKFRDSFGFAAFAGFGDVAEDIAKINTGDMKVSAGFGLRYVLDKKEGVNLRIDFGICKDSSNIYFTMMEAF